MKVSSVYPPGALNVNGFSFFNAVSFQIVLGAPIILFAKSLGASSFVLGTIAALTPLLNILQLLAARFLHRVGYKRFLLSGWGARTFFTFCIAVLPLLPGLSIPTRLGLLIAALFCFNLLRGFSAGAWLPWLTALVPAPVRGRFLSRDNAFMHLGCLAALLLSAWVMTGSVEADEYAAVFGIGLLSALVSLWFVHRIPEVESAEDRKQSGVAVPWGAMLRFPPFAKLLWFTTIYMTVIGSLGVFTVEYLVVRGKFAESMILLLSAWSFLGALAGLAITAPRLDATGSKPWLRHGLVIMALVILGWFFLASGLLPGWPALVAGLNFFGGLAGAIFGVANTRIMMGSVPAMGRNHFFALFTVVSGLGLGGAPMVWGAMLDTLGTLDVVLGVVTVNRYSVYFAALVVLAWLALRLIPGLHEGAVIEAAPPTAADARPVAPVE
jgi:MFS family permease